MSFKDECEKYGVVLDGRWESGTDHHSEANDLLRQLYGLDFEEYNDHFSWSVGGDGDNGEILIEQFSVILELRDSRLEEQYPDAYQKATSLCESDNITLLEAAMKLLESQK